MRMVYDKNNLKKFAGDQSNRRNYKKVSRRTLSSRRRVV